LIEAIAMPVFPALNPGGMRPWQKYLALSLGRWSWPNLITKRRF
jgi:hypothetical protein